MLEEDGHAVEVVASGADAIARLDDSPPFDVLVTDLVMRGASGTAVMYYARSVRPGLPVIFITEYPLLLLRLNVSDPPPDVLTKPVSYVEFSALLDRIARTASAKLPG